MMFDLPTLQSVFHPAATDARTIAQLTWILIIGATVILLGVCLLAWRAVRRGAGPIKPLHWIVGGGVLLPLVVLTPLLAFSTWRSAELTMPASQGALAITVTAKMWWWEVRYSDPQGGKDIVLANEIHVPAGRPVYLSLISNDVIHSFWVPALGGKVDMVPGRPHGMRVQVDQPGRWRGQCAEYCGAQHARMALFVVAEAPAAFDTWLAGQSQPAMLSATNQNVRGRDVFVAQRCGACHTVRGVTEAASLGPDLTHIGSRSHLAAGTLPNSPRTMADWIANPHAAKPGVRMPAASDLDPASLQALASWMEQLK
jgi:cytochrome c oxidase subunit 2